MATYYVWHFISISVLWYINIYVITFVIYVYNNFGMYMVNIDIIRETPDQMIRNPNESNKPQPFGAIKYL